MSLIESFGWIVVLITMIVLLIGWCGVLAVVAGDFFDDWRKRRKKP